VAVGGITGSQLGRKHSARRGGIVGGGFLALLILGSTILGAGTGRVGATTRDVRPTRASTVAAARSAAAASRAAGPAGKIKHVVVVYQENHSFDETLGKFCQMHHHRCDGYTGPVRLASGEVVDMFKSPDPVPGVFHNVLAQTNAVNGGAMDGWGKVTGCHPPASHRWCLSYYTPKQIPNLTALASKFVVSDRTFSMYNSPSWGGHIYPAAATQDNFNGDIPSPVPGHAHPRGWGCISNLQSAWVNPVTHKPTQQPSCIPARPGTLDPTLYPYNGPYRPSPVAWVPTIFDRLDDKALSWKIYTSTKVWSICPTFAECAFGPQHLNVVRTQQILSDAASGRLPAYSILLPDGLGGVTSQHNGSSMRVGDNWIGRVLATLQQSPQWSSTAVFITYDDCGCFYDHVPPGTNPDGSQQGIRMPMVIVSPYAKHGYTDSKPATFASILHFTEKTFGLKPLGVNDANAYAYANSFNFAARPSGPRAVLRRHPVSAATRHFLATHPMDPDDPT
jgi:phospholipase C